MRRWMMHCEIDKFDELTCDRTCIIIGEWLKKLESKIYACSNT